jgi:alanyl-tRNA synthetase
MTIEICREQAADYDICGGSMKNSGVAKHIDHEEVSCCFAGSLLRPNLHISVASTNRSTAKTKNPRPSSAMPVTERLYYNDSHLIEFEARVIDHTERVSGWTAVTLDRTAFYPTGGGQPSDTGTINDVRVVECIDDEANGILHVIQGRAPAVGSTVKGRVDWARRLDHMQQHTGQHILSQAFISLFKAPTRGFRVLEQTCEIDVELANPTTEVIERAVGLANNVIWEDRAITIKEVSSNEAAALPLRKEPSRGGDLRVIEIEGFDLTPCGGTHAYRTGEVGIIVVRSWERAKGLTRIEFLAGNRAYADYRRANSTARDTAALFSASRDDAPALAVKMVEENKDLHRRLRVLEEVAARVEAEELLRAGETSDRNSAKEKSRELRVQRVRDSSNAAVADNSRWLTAQRDTAAKRSAHLDDNRGADVHHEAADRAAITDISRGLSSRDNPASVSKDSPDSGAFKPSDAKITYRLITKIFEQRDAESLKHLALALIAHPQVIALLASRDKETARLVFARSADATGDMNKLMREACAMLDGRGGGKPDMAQGAGKSVEKLDEAIQQAARLLGELARS